MASKVVAPPAQVPADGAPLDPEFLRIARSPGERPSSLLGLLWEWFNFFAALILLFPIRVVLMLITFPLIWLMYRLSICFACCSKESDSDKLARHSRTQKLVIWLTAMLYRLLCLWVGVVWIRISRRKGDPDDVQQKVPYTIIANHVSMLDGPLVGLSQGGMQITGVAASWVTKLPFVSTVAKAHHVLAVGGNSGSKDTKVAPTSHQSKPKTATDTIVEYQRKCAVDHGLLPLLVFPEGFTKAARCLLKFRTGAFVSGEPVRPVVLKYPECFAWVQPSIAAHIFLVLTRWLHCVEVIFLPLYIPNADEKSDPQLYANNVQAVIAEAMGLPPERVSTTIGKEVFSGL